MKRDFKGVWIAREIWLEDGLTLIEKCLLVEINSLDGEAGCFASNAYFINFLNSSESTVKRSLAALKKLGYITIISGERRIIHSNLKTIIQERKKAETISNMVDAENKHYLVEEIENEYPRVAKLETPISNKEAMVLLSKYDITIIREVLADMNNFKQLLTKYTSASRTLENWIKRRGGNNSTKAANTGMVY